MASADFIGSYPSIENGKEIPFRSTKKDKKRRTLLGISISFAIFAAHFWRAGKFKLTWRSFILEALLLLQPLSTGTLCAASGNIFVHWGNCSFLSTLRFLRLLKLRQVFLLFFPELLLRWPRFFQSPAVGHLNTLVDGLDSTHPPPLPTLCFCAYSHWFWALTAFHFFTSFFPLGLEESQDFFLQTFFPEHSSEKKTTF